MLHCQQCGSRAIRKSSAVYEQGTAVKTSQRRGTSYGRSGLRVSSGNTTSTRTTGAAAHNAPPEDMKPVFSLVAGAIIGSLLGLASSNVMACFLFTIIGCFGGLFLALMSGSDSHKAAMALYRRQWYCTRCGAISHAPEADSDSDAALSPSTNRVNAIPQEYVERLISPIQRARSETDRDLVGLRTIAARTAPDGTFDPLLPYSLDLGLVSRLASLGYLAWDSTAQRCRLTDRGSARAAEAAAVAPPA